MAGDTAPHRLRAPPDARWSCTGCGECCRNILVPIEPDLVERLKQARVETAWPAASKTPWYTSTQLEKRDNELTVTQIHGHCIFLRQDNLCALHALFGEQWKPNACREFPIRLIRDPNGVAAVARPSCIELFMHWRDGEHVKAQGEHRLHERSLPKIAVFNREQIRINARLQVPLAEWMVTEDTILSHLAAQTVTIEQAMVAVRDMVYANTGQTPPAPSVNRYRVATAGIIESLLFPLDAALRQGADRFDPGLRAVAAEWLAHLELAWRADSRAVPIDNECHAYLNMCLQGELLSKSCHDPHSIAAGLGLFMAGIQIVRSCFPNATEPVTCEQLAPLYARWLRLISNRTVSGLIQQNPTALTNLFHNICA